jgi:hypothetical protein
MSFEGLDPVSARSNVRDVAQFFGLIDGAQNSCVMHAAAT